MAEAGREMAVVVTVGEGAASNEGNANDAKVAAGSGAMAKVERGMAEGLEASEKGGGKLKAGNVEEGGKSNMVERLAAEGEG